MVFVPTNVLQVLQKTNDPKVLRQLTNLVKRAVHSLCPVTKRSVGDQPGQETPRYISEWKMVAAGHPHRDEQIQPVESVPCYLSESIIGGLSAPISFHFDQEKPDLLDAALYHLQFAGQLASGRDELIPLGEGSIFFNGGVPMW